MASNIKKYLFVDEKLWNTVRDFITFFPFIKRSYKNNTFFAFVKVSFPKVILYSYI